MKECEKSKFSDKIKIDEKLLSKETFLLCKKHYACFGAKRIYGKFGVGNKTPNAKIDSRVYTQIFKLL